MAGNKNSGRKSKKWHKAQVKRAMVETAQEAAGYIKAVFRGQLDPDWKMIDLCKFVLNHELGLPRQRTEMIDADGRPLTYPQIILLAQQQIVHNSDGKTTVSTEKVEKCESVLHDLADKNAISLNGISTCSDFPLGSCDTKTDSTPAKLLQASTLELVPETQESVKSNS